MAGLSEALGFISGSLNVWLVFGLGLGFQWHGYSVSPPSEELGAGVRIINH